MLPTEVQMFFLPYDQGKMYSAVNVQKLYYNIIYYIIVSQYTYYYDTNNK